ncbi:MAG: RNA polymerase sigma factor [Candidatus Acidiferrales bacterium]
MDFQSLYENYAPAVRRFALFLCGDPMIADDVTSETFLRALRAHAHIRQPTVRSYLFAIAQNAYRDVRRRSRQQAELDVNKPDAGISAQARLEQNEEVRVVLAALQELPEIDRTILLMRVLDDVPHEEIASVVGVSVTAAKVKVHRARAKLMAIRNPARERVVVSGEEI